MNENVFFQYFMSPNPIGKNGEVSIFCLNVFLNKKIQNNSSMFPILEKTYNFSDQKRETSFYLRKKII